MWRTKSDILFRRDLFLMLRNTQDLKRQLQERTLIMYVLWCLYEVHNLTSILITRYTRDTPSFYKFIVLYNIRLTVQLLPYNHSLQTEFHVPEISGTNRNNMSRYACCEKLWGTSTTWSRRFTTMSTMFVNGRTDGGTGKLSMDENSIDAQ